MIHKLQSIPTTYRELKIAINELTEEQLDMSVTVLDDELGEMLPIADLMLFSEMPPEIQDNHDLDENQPLLIT